MRPAGDTRRERPLEQVERVRVREIDLGVADPGGKGCDPVGQPHEVPVSAQVGPGLPIHFDDPVRDRQAGQFIGQRSPLRQCHTGLDADCRPCPKPAEEHLLGTARDDVASMVDHEHSHENFLRAPAPTFSSCCRCTHVTQAHRTGFRPLAPAGRQQRSTKNCHAPVNTRILWGRTEAARAAADTNLYSVLRVREMTIRARAILQRGAKSVSSDNTSARGVGRSRWQAFRSRHQRRWSISPRMNA